MRTCNIRGYTLIEVLVAMAIFTAVISLATAALVQGLNQYKGLLDKGIGIWENARTLWLDKSLNSTLDYFVKDREVWFPYFRGTDEYITYVSLAPVAGDLPVVAWLRKEREADGTYSLVYYELPVYTKGYAELEGETGTAAYRRGQTVRMLEGAKDIRFSFYWKDAQSSVSRWTGEFEGRKANVLPRLVRIGYRQADEERTLLFAVNVNSARKLGYNER